VTSETHPPTRSKSPASCGKARLKRGRGTFGHWAELRCVRPSYDEDDDDKAKNRLEKYFLMIAGKYPQLFFKLLFEVMLLQEAEKAKGNSGSDG
jgi:hypothetical protein